ncbi:MAG: hypothetical protein UT42_C0040G0007 [Candidatus Falkowbacteria bacterium GW2011_GWA2_39_24]|uniref:Uncharacterized protein n=1 Tax=Candidatus Falkowbacteria bacterium GW2011_GWA2_39_24 TaxID=1618634 RepID=A0A0G0NLM1_9BACT|nr:MAG: hypothetical protein UT42_C0040G0007 [Candidatus Falkowbacteria bacterium GW2011_GWA2_39_24]
MGKNTQTLTNNPEIKELIITGTAQQIQRIWHNRDKWTVGININDQTVDLKLKREPSCIKIKLDTDNPCRAEEWPKLNFSIKFQSKSKTASTALWPLKQNGMIIQACGHVVSKKNIHIET